MEKKTSAVEKKIMDAAVELFKRDGYEGVSINAICKHAGINRSSFYNIFADKDDIIIRMFAITEHNLQSVMGGFIAAENDFERMWMLCDKHLSLVLQLGPTITYALYRIKVIRDVGFTNTQKEINDWCIKLYKNCLALGIARSYASPEELVPLVTQTVMQITYEWCCDNGKFPLRETARRATEVLYGILPEYCWPRK